MSKNPLDRYDFYVPETCDGKPYQVIAVSSFAGRKVRGIAKCNPNDTFNLENGKRLAAARCNRKIAKRRMARAADKYSDAFAAVLAANERYEKARQYYMDAIDKSDEAIEELKNILAEMGMNVEMENREN